MKKYEFSQNHNSSFPVSWVFISLSFPSLLKSKIPTLWPTTWNTCDPRFDWDSRYYYEFTDEFLTNSMHLKIDFDLIHFYFEITTIQKNCQISLWLFNRQLINFKWPNIWANSGNGSPHISTANALQGCSLYRECASGWYLWCVSRWTNRTTPGPSAQRLCARCRPWWSVGRVAAPSSTAGQTPHADPWLLSAKQQSVSAWNALYKPCDWRCNAKATLRVERNETHCQWDAIALRNKFKHCSEEVYSRL